VRHFAAASFWQRYDALPEAQQRTAVWSVRVGLDYRALATAEADGYSWFWIGTHAEYDRLVR
jgi:hypothetical protein